jgi:hypothetical protein
MPRAGYWAFLTFARPHNNTNIPDREQSRPYFLKTSTEEILPLLKETLVQLPPE